MKTFEELEEVVQSINEMERIFKGIAIEAAHMEEIQRFIVLIFIDLIRKGGSPMGLTALKIFAFGILAIAAFSVVKTLIMIF